VLNRNQIQKIVKKLNVFRQISLIVASMPQILAYRLRCIFIWTVELNSIKRHANCTFDTIWKIGVVSSDRICAVFVYIGLSQS